MKNKGWRRAAARRRCYYMKKKNTMIGFKNDILNGWEEDGDPVENTHKAYSGQFWNHHIKEFQTWKENQKWEEKFASFCSRMWLDYCDENNTLYSYHLDKIQYIDKYESYLVKRFLENDESV